MVQLVLVCGGRGTRFPGRPPGLPKSCLPLHGEPLAQRLYRQLLPFHDPRASVIVIAAAGNPHVAALFQGRAIVVGQEQPDGVASAIALALPHLVGDALVALGDVVLEGDFVEPWPAAPALAVWRAAPPKVTRDNYGIRVHEGAPVELIEKPDEPADLLCGIGVYLLTRAVIEGFQASVPDARGERAITDALARSVAGGTRYGLLELAGRYVNVNTAEDLAEAEATIT